MDIQQLRLELVRLTHAHGRDISEAVSRAQTLEAYICEEERVKEQEDVPQPKRRVVRQPK